MTNVYGSAKKNITGHTFLSSAILRSSEQSIIPNLLSFEQKRRVGHSKSPHFPPDPHHKGRNLLQSPHKVPVFRHISPGSPLPSGKPLTSAVRPWQTRTHCCGHIVADTNVSSFARARNICCGHKFCVRETKKCSGFVQLPVNLGQYL